MNDRLENTLSMFQKVQGTLLLHATETASIVAVGALSVELDDQVNSILALVSQVNTDIRGYTVDKQAKRLDLKTRIVKLGSAVVAFTAFNDSFIPNEKCDASPNQINKMRDNDLYTYAKLVINEVTPIMASLAPYGVVASDLAAANASVTHFLEVIKVPKNQISERSANKKILATLFADTSALLNKKLDKVMGVFITTNPNLYYSYLGARSIDDTGVVTS